VIYLNDILITLWRKDDKCIVFDYSPDMLTIKGTNTAGFSSTGKPGNRINGEWDWDRERGPVSHDKQASKQNLFTALSRASTNRK
jgi:hypothetical protein